MFYLKVMPWSLYMIHVYKFYILFISCISIFPAWYLVKSSYKIILKIFPRSKFFQSVFLFQAEPADRPGRPDLVSGRARLCTSVGRPTGRPAENRLLTVFCRSAERSTDQKFLLSVFCRAADRSTDSSKLCFISEAGRPTDRPEPNGYMPAGLTADRTGRPPSLQSPNGSFLFGDFLKPDFYSVCVADFLGLLGTYFGPYELN